MAPAWPGWRGPGRSPVASATASDYLWLWAGLIRAAARDRAYPSRQDRRDEAESGSAELCRVYTRGNRFPALLGGMDLRDTLPRAAPPRPSRAALSAHSEQVLRLRAATRGRGPPHAASRALAGGKSWTLIGQLTDYHAARLRIAVQDQLSRDRWL